jgi:uncharacterized cupin superfamily protein
MSNFLEPQFDPPAEREGFQSRRAKLGAQAGAEHLGLSLYEIEPGSAPFPLHYHLDNEELLIVIAGQPSLRTPNGERRLTEGEVVSFPVGEAGAHQVVNRSDAPVRIMILSEMNAPEIAIRPESGKLSAFGRPPGSTADGIHDVYFRRDAVEFWEGEEPPPPAP